jgi:hypothetical protein
MNQIIIRTNIKNIITYANAFIKANIIGIPYLIAKYITVPMPINSNISKLEHGQGNAPCKDGFADHSVRLLGRRALYLLYDSWRDLLVINCGK